MLSWILLISGVAFLWFGYVLRRRLSNGVGAASRKQKRLRVLSLLLMLVGIYVILTRVIDIVFGAREGESMEFSLWAERVELFGFSLSTTVILTWIAMGFVLTAAVLFRVTVIRKFSLMPRGAQNAIEVAVEKILKYTGAQTHNEAGEVLGSYIFAVALLLISCAGLELFGLRAPTADITMTLALAILTFILINWYGVKKKGARGRIKSLASPTPVVFVIRILTDLAIPVSMASRLFGNMLGGMIVMDLLYTSLGNNAVGIPSVIGLYFNVFHPLIQAFIFITLTLTFINEAIE